MLQQEVLETSGLVSNEPLQSIAFDAYLQAAPSNNAATLFEHSAQKHSDKVAYPFEEQCFTAMRSSGLSMLVIFAEEEALLEPLKNLILSVEEEVRKYNIQDAHMQLADDIDLFGSIDALETVHHLAEVKQVLLKKNRLKRKLAEWAPCTYLIESALNSFLDSENVLRLPNSVIRKLERSKQLYYAHRNRMVQANIRLVYSVANRFRYVALTYEDLVQEGHLGLIKAVERFDFSKGFRFSTYAHIVISQSIHLAIDKQASLVRLPFKALREKISVDKTRQKLEQTLGRTPTSWELDQQLPNDLEYKATHISNAVDPNANSQQLFMQPDDAELIEERSAADQDGITSRAKYADLAQQLLNELDEREASIIRMRFGIGLNKEFTLEEISQSIGLSRERVRQLAHHAVEKLGLKFGGEN